MTKIGENVESDVIKGIEKSIGNYEQNIRNNEMIVAEFRIKRHNASDIGDEETCERCEVAINKLADGINEYRKRLHEMQIALVFETKHSTNLEETT